MKAEKSPTRRALQLTVIAISLAAVIVGTVAYWQHRDRTSRLLTLAEVLWVTERDFSRYYAPGTPQSQAVVQALAVRDSSLSQRRFDSFILYRRGLTETDRGEEPLLVVGFDPSSIPAAQKKLF